MGGVLTPPWSVPRDWTGETVFILGGGPSLRGFDVSCLAGRRVITINNSWELNPDADVLLFCDLRWWQRHGERVKKGFSGTVVSMCTPTPDPAIKRLRNTGRTGLETQPDGLRHGSNSGYQAIGLAYHFGAARIVLLGYDQRVDGQNTHWHEGHGQDAHTVQHRFGTMLKYFPKLVEPLAQAGVEVINATPNSALTVWPYRPIEEFLESPVPVREPCFSWG